jgi:hypothetical protein
MTAIHHIHDQLLYEVGVWKKEIEKIQFDNFEMKKQLIFLLQKLNGKELLESLEKYQTLFLMQDRLIEILRNDVFLQSGSLNICIPENIKRQRAKQIKKHKKIRNEIIFCEKETIIIKEEFDVFVENHHTNTNKQSFDS